ncbi:MAG: hypothetical protein PSU94_18305 [Lacunisphaera sp.]|nr:hypothetical protein [Lacunisphaera sp.]
MLITAGTEDQGADPRGMFLAEVAAGPVYRLLGRRGLEVDTMPVDVPCLAGDLAFFCHTGSHALTDPDWRVFLDYADSRLK